MGDSDPSWYQGAWSGWLKEFAPANILFMYVTLDTFQLLSGWLNELAFANIPLIYHTLDTSQLLISPYLWIL